jgi:translation initiation factor 3 subunit H
MRALGGGGGGRSWGGADAMERSQMQEALAASQRTRRLDPVVEDDKTEIERIEVDALVILQIMKHCRQHAPHPVTGQLLGLDVGGVLELTHCFGYVQKGGGDDHERNAQTQDDGEQYQLDMLKRLREVNVDSNTVGWYQTTHLGQFFSDTVIDTQYLYQKEIPRSVLLVYDPLQSRIGKPAFKALRLTSQFMEKYAETRELNKSALTDLPSNGMFMELPISITSPAITEAFLIDWALADSSSTTQLETLDVENQAFMEKNTQLLIGSLQDLAEEQQKIQQYERQASGRQDPKGKGRGFRQVQQPRQLDTMILSQQIQNYCKQINNSAADSFGKIFLMSNKPGGVQQKK